MSGCNAFTTMRWLPCSLGASSPPASPFSVADPSPPEPTHSTDAGPPPRAVPHTCRFPSLHQEAPACSPILASPRMLGLHDYRRSYVLPAGIDNNIPITGRRQRQPLHAIPPQRLRSELC